MAKKAKMAGVFRIKGSGGKNRRSNIMVWRRMAFRRRRRFNNKYRDEE